MSEWENASMMVMVQFSADEELKALPLLLRGTSGRILKGRRYVIDDSAVKMLKKAGVRFKTVSGNGIKPKPRGAAGHEGV